MGRGITQASEAAAPSTSTTTTTSHISSEDAGKLYPQELQLKLYQAFIFSIPILFSIILLLLFYLFYLKRRASSSPSSTGRRLDSTNNNQASFVSSPCHAGMKKELIKEKLHVIQFDENLRAKDSLCCVCLGEFQLKEELRQVPTCKHVFHFDCIQSWLRTNATCPLCRCHVFMFSSAMVKPLPLVITPHEGGVGGVIDYQGQIGEEGSNVASVTREEGVV